MVALQYPPTFEVPNLLSARIGAPGVAGRSGRGQLARSCRNTPIAGLLIEGGDQATPAGPVGGMPHIVRSRRCSGRTDPARRGCAAERSPARCRCHTQGFSALAGPVRDDKPAGDVVHHRRCRQHASGPCNHGDSLPARRSQARVAVSLSAAWPRHVVAQHRPVKTTRSATPNSVSLRNLPTSGSAATHSCGVMISPTMTNSASGTVGSASMTVSKPLPGNIFGCTDSYMRRALGSRSNRASVENFCRSMPGAPPRSGASPARTGRVRDSLPRWRLPRRWHGERVLSNLARALVDFRPGWKAGTSAQSGTSVDTGGQLGGDTRHPEVGVRQIRPVVRHSTVGPDTPHKRPGGPVGPPGQRHGSPGQGTFTTVSLGGGLVRTGRVGPPGVGITSCPKACHRRGQLGGASVLAPRQTGSLGKHGDPHNPHHQRRSPAAASLHCGVTPIIGPIKTF